MNPDNAFNLTAATGAQNKPDIAVGDGFFHVVYADGGDVKYTQLTALLGSEELISDLEISVYPNPTTDQITFSIGEASSATWRLEISNNLGQIVKAVEVKHKAETTINTKLFESGVYHYSLVLENGIKKGQFVVK